MQPYNCKYITTNDYVVSEVQMIKVELEKNTVSLTSVEGERNQLLQLERTAVCV